MKHFILTLMILFIGFVKPIDANAQTYTYRSTSFAYKYVNSWGNWTNWSDWTYSDVYITINYSTDVVNMYSQQPQCYRITQYVKKYIDSGGGQQVEFKFVDQDGDRGTMRLRIESNGNSQIYIDFADIMWVYNVVRV